MKRRFICLFLSLLVLLSVSQICVSANDKRDVDEIIFLEDGSYIEVEIIESVARSAKSGSKSYTYKNASGEAKWKATLNGTFTYDGTTSSCTSASCSVAVYDDEWYLETKHAYRSGNTAYASVTMGITALGVTTSKTTYKLTLSCDKNGNLS